MLQAVDVPVAVARPDGTHDPVLVSHLPGLRKTPEPGPRGWSGAIRAIVLGRDERGKP
ncbi:MAG: hypothetical protein HY000_25445 [Planctomycetes bacterium]|nr:hypothetical protein [Planctomycetota bacterium]